MSTWSQVSTVSNSSYVVQKIKCFEEGFKIGALYDRSDKFLASGFFDNLLSGAVQLIGNILEGIFGSGGELFDVHYYFMNITE